jgi:hypothetical protein
MYPHERSLVKRLENQPFVLLGVNSDKDHAEVRKVVKQEKLTWRSFWNGGGTGGPISRAWGVKGWPTLFVIDAEGIVRARIIGANEAEVDKVVNRLVGEVGRELVVKTPEKSPEKKKPPARVATSPRTDDPARLDKLAEIKLGFAKTLAEDGKLERARQRLKEIIDRYPSTDAAREAKELLASWKN